jgi:hypothetical protein
MNSRILQALVAAFLVAMLVKPATLLAAESRGGQATTTHALALLLNASGGDLVDRVSTGPVQTPLPGLREAQLACGGEGAPCGALAIAPCCLGYFCSYDAKLLYGRCSAYGPVN